MKTASIAMALVVLAACGSSDNTTTGDSPSDGGTTSGSSGTTSSSGSGTSGSSSSASSSGSSGSSSSGDAGSGDGGTDGGGAPLTVFTIVMENHDYAEIVGSANAPYFNQLIADYGLATNYQDSGTHPSLPNYLTMTSGDPQYIGIVDLDPTTTPFPTNQPNLGTQLEAAKIPWRSYQEGMTTPCALQAAGDYAPRHDPFLYFTDMQVAALCAEHNVDYSNFPADLAAGTYRYMWITPDLTDDGHDPAADPVTGLKDSDTWAAANIPAILASAAFQANGILFLTWDEAEGRNGDSKEQIPMIVVSSRIKSAGYQSATAYSHKSYLATVEDLFGMPRLATVKTTASMLEFFK